MRLSTTDSPVHLIPNVILSSYSATVRSLGLDPTELLECVGLDPRCLIVPNMQVSASRATEAIELAAMKAGVTDFGIRLALARGVPDLGPLNLLLHEEPDVRSALRSLQSYLHVHSRSMRISLDEADDFPILRGSLVVAAAMAGTPQTTEMMLCGVLQTLRWLIGKDWSPAAVYFSHPAPGNPLPQKQVFGCPVEFGMSLDGLILTSADLRRQISHSPPMLRQHAESYVRALENGSRGDFAETVSGLIAAMLPTGRCSSARVARHLAMDRATLGRRLAALGKTYSSLLQETRQHLAEKFCGWNWPLADVADQLGFSSTSVFSRWFRTTYAMTPSAWRKARRSA
ncbi:AraC family transcriptional regulator [Sphingomonas naphthae]|uniref:AraC family transcriptional regulator n=1 Tax=Sphingomonas naphthae TaxID=1813468 RepID=A0ABY7TG85_9SPHN|nr:AraC family transcriptional regulator [Sphingomonas naphthae]WCT72242.1 AraC family transcriptional regulator [Sphingomonas naphthae]